MANCRLMRGDCLEKMKLIEDNSVDLILADPPYGGTTACKWDSVIDLDLMWIQLKRVIKTNGAIVLFGNEPFSSNLRMSNINDYRYDWIWNKKIPSGMSYARYQPMRQHENILVFYKNKSIYNAQKIKRPKPTKQGGNKYSPSGAPIQNRLDNGKWEKKIYTHKNPVTIISFDKIRRGSVHPTQKPVDLMKYLIKTYTNKGDTVLDFTMGSGTTGVACKLLKRNFIGIELDKKYFKIAKERIKNTKIKPRLIEE